ncbi:MAG: PorP/SprF family type IX secretion system membrane protein [Bacteroidota bacterium]
MKKIKLLIFVVLCLAFIEPVKAQQAPFYTQYMFNDYLVNPAVAGSNNYFQIRANSRIQWIGMSEAPRTMSVAAYGPFKERPMGYGGYIFNDVTGPESRLSLGGTYSYNLMLTDMMRISGGITIGLMQYKLDGTQIKIGDQVGYDPAFPDGVESQMIPDASAGVYLYSTYYYVGISAHQLLGNKFNLHEDLDSVDTDMGINRLKQHLYLSGGYHFILNRDFVLQPSALIKYTGPGYFQAEINVKATYQRMIWGGLSYRTGDAVAVLLGYNYENKIYFGLSYDITVSELRRYSNGTIEVMIGYRFNDVK